VSSALIISTCGFSPMEQAPSELARFSALLEESVFADWRPKRAPPLAKSWCRGLRIMLWTDSSHSPYVVASKDNSLQIFGLSQEI
jgi:hypothetical protein